MVHQFITLSILACYMSLFSHSFFSYVFVIYQHFALSLIFLTLAFVHFFFFSFLLFLAFDLLSFFFSFWCGSRPSFPHSCSMPFQTYNSTRTMEMQVYTMNACFQIGQGGRKESEWPKGVKQRIYFFYNKQRIYLLVKCLGHTVQK